VTLLVVDIGNSTTKVGAWEGGVVRAVSINPTPDSAALVDRVSDLLSAAEASGAQEFEVALCSVVPDAEKIWLDWCARHDRPAFVVRGDTPAPLANAYRPPARLGGDRLAAAVGAVRRFGAPLIVAHLGTTVVVDAISANREFLGGAIWVGLATGFAVLAQRTAALPRVTGKPPSSPIGSDTETCLHAGATYGTAALVEGLADRMRSLVGQEAPLVLTGGDAELLTHFLECEHELAPLLTLEGVGIIWDHNHGKTDAAR